MKYAIQINSSTSRIEHATYLKYVNVASAERYVIVDHLPTGETQKEMDIHNYLYVDREFVYDPLPEPEQPEPEATTDDVLNALLGVKV